MKDYMEVEAAVLDRVAETDAYKNADTATKQKLFEDEMTSTMSRYQTFTGLSGGPGGYDPVEASKRRQEQNKKAAEDPGGKTGDDFTTTAQKAEQRVKQNVEARAAKAAQAKAGTDVEALHRQAIYGQSDRVNELGSREPMTEADALDVYTKLHGLWGSLSAEGQKLAADALYALYERFPNAKYPKIASK